MTHNHSPYGERDAETEPAYDFRDPASKGRDGYRYLILRGEEDTETIALRRQGCDYSYEVERFTPVDADGNPVGEEKSLCVAQMQTLRDLAATLQAYGDDLDLLASALRAVDELASVGVKGMFNGKRRKMLSLIRNAVAATRAIIALRLARQREQDAAADATL